MVVGEIAELFAIIALVAFGLAVANFAIKLAYREWIAKMKPAPAWVEGYKKLMRYNSQFHRWFGIVCAVAVIIHTFLSVLYLGTPVSGIVVGVALVSVAALGFYKTYINKAFNPKLFLTLHRYAALVTILAVIFHDIQVG